MGTMGPEGRLGKGSYKATLFKNSTTEISHTAKAAMAAVFGPGPKRGRMAAYHQVIRMPRKRNTKMKKSSAALPLVRGRSAGVASPSFCCPKSAVEPVARTIRTTPASTPPRTIRLPLNFSIVDYFLIPGKGKPEYENTNTSG